MMELLTRRELQTIRAALYRAADWSEPVDPNDGDAAWQHREKKFIKACRAIVKKLAAHLSDSRHKPV